MLSVADSSMGALALLVNVVSPPRHPLVFLHSLHYVLLIHSKKKIRAYEGNKAFLDHDNDAKSSFLIGFCVKVLDHLCVSPLG